MIWVASLAAALVFVLAYRLRRASHERRALEGVVARANQDLEHLERAFARFAPPDVVEHIAEGHTEIAPQRRKVTVMFADLVGFTTMCERLDPAVVVPMLNGYFRRMSQVIRAHHGLVSRIMGDGLMALFGALDDNPWQAADAVRAALDMRTALIAYNVELVAQGLPELAFGVGINAGEVVAAVVGSDELMEYTVMGDAVNLAARVETLTRVHAADILITSGVRAQLDPRFRLRENPPTAVKGKSEPVVTWSVEGLDETAQSVDR